MAMAMAMAMAVFMEKKKADDIEEKAKGSDDGDKYGVGDELRVEEPL